MALPAFVCLPFEGKKKKERCRYKVLVLCYLLTYERSSVKIVDSFGVVSYVLYTLFLIPGSTHSRLEARDVGDFLRREVCLWIAKNNP